MDVVDFICSLRWHIVTLIWRSIFQFLDIPIVKIGIIIILPSDRPELILSPAHTKNIELLSPKIYIYFFEI